MQLQGDNDGILWHHATHLHTNNVTVVINLLNQLPQLPNSLLDQ